MWYLVVLFIAKKQKNIVWQSFAQIMYVFYLTPTIHGDINILGEKKRFGVHSLSWIIGRVLLAFCKFCWYTIIYMFSILVITFHRRLIFKCAIVKVTVIYIVFIIYLATRLTWVRSHFLYFSYFSYLQLYQVSHLSLLNSQI